MRTDRPSAEAPVHPVICLALFFVHLLREGQVVPPARVQATHRGRVRGTTGCQISRRA